MESQKAKNYQQAVKEHESKKGVLKMCLRAYIAGGLICCLGQAIRDTGERLLGLQGDLLSAFTSIGLVFLGALLTALGQYDKISGFAGAGGMVPITGFANSMTAPAMEFRAEGYVAGIGARMFSVAGPVLVYGVLASIAAGLLSLLLP